MLKEKEEGDLAILEAGGRWIAPGHNSIITDDAGQDWIIYHAIDKNDRWMYPEQEKEDKRVVLIDRIEYKDGWPIVAGNIPSDSIASAPVINKNKSAK